MSDPRVQHQIRQVESRRDGIRDNLRAHEREIAQLERDLRDAGRHTDAYLRQQDIQRRISSVQGSIRSAERELARSERELQNLRSMAS
jgi:chromosome segregation ATPase